MSSLFGTNFGSREKLKRQGRTMISTWHEGVYHAAKPCQAASLSLTRLGLRGLKKACQVESQNNPGFLACIEHDQCELRQLSGSACMLVLGLHKGSRLIALVMLPHGKDVGWEADEVPYRSFFDFLPPNWTCAFQRIQLSSIAVSPSIRGLCVHQLDVLSSHGMPVLDIHMTRSTQDQGFAFPGCHYVNPSGFVATGVFFQVFERPDVMNLDFVCKRCRSTLLADLCE